MDANTFRNKFFAFFKSNGHVVIPSASLIPENDPTVLFNTAGMQPLVPYLLGLKHPLGKRLVNMQKCLRTVDIDNIGDNTHHTFFQMLGNWSLGDYFRKEAINWSFEFLTSSKWMNIPKEQLAITVYKGDSNVPRDEESVEIWQSLGISEDRIAYMGADDNFWSAGETGPCGPDTEIFYWTGKSPAPDKFDPSDDNWVEIWNNVFMTYNRLNNGKIEMLKQKNVDTGMGLERALAILNKKESAYETDLFFPVIQKLEKLTSKNYKEHKREFRIIADHIRASVFLIADGCLPSNVESGYVLRRLIRRAIRFGSTLGLNESFIQDVAKEFIGLYMDWYPELSENKDKIFGELNKEESKFRNTLTRGLKVFNKLTKKGNLTHKEAFLLYQSYGFPVEMTNELAKEKGINLNLNKLKEVFKEHQEASKKGSKQKFKGGLSDASENTVRLHTATHLLNEALRKIISKDIKQKGSNITPERLRFDFNYDKKLTDEELRKVEDEVNRVIDLGLNVNKDEMSLKDALNSGAQAEFGAKYPEKVTIYSIGDYSKEICMGPHVKNTKELGHFKIIKEESSSAGIRRIKAILE